MTRQKYILLMFILCLGIIFLGKAFLRHFFHARSTKLNYDNYEKLN